VGAGGVEIGGRGQALYRRGLRDLALVGLVTPRHDGCQTAWWRKGPFGDDLAAADQAGVNRIAAGDGKGPARDGDWQAKPLGHSTGQIRAHRGVPEEADPRLLPAESLRDHSKKGVRVELGQPGMIHAQHPVSSPQRSRHLLDLVPDQQGRELRLQPVSQSTPGGEHRVRQFGHFASKSLNDNADFASHDDISHLRDYAAIAQ